MSVKVTIPQFLQSFTDGKEVAYVSGSTVGECLNELTRQFPDIKTLLFDKDGKLLQRVDIYVNGKSSYPEELAKQVSEGDELYILLVIAGG